MAYKINMFPVNKNENPPHTQIDGKFGIHKSQTLQFEVFFPRLNRIS